MKKFYAVYEKNLRNVRKKSTLLNAAIIIATKWPVELLLLKIQISFFDEK